MNIAHALLVQNRDHRWSIAKSLTDTTIVVVMRQKQPCWSGIRVTGNGCAVMASRVRKTNHSLEYLLNL